MASQLSLVDEWKKRDPFMQDVDGFTKFVEARAEAENLVRLVKLGHPDEHGEPFTRSQVLRRISDKGIQILKDLGWPTDKTSLYKNPFSEPVALGQLLRESTDGLDPFRREMHKLQEKINELTKGELYGEFAAVGLECTTVSEIRKLIKKHAGSYTVTDSELYKIVEKAVLLHKGFYEQLSQCLLTDDYLKNNLCEQNILKMARWFGMDVDNMVPLDQLPPKRWDTWIWSLLERYWEPYEEVS